MKRDFRQICKKGAAILMAVSFFGIFYPELCMLEDTCRVVYLNAAGEEEEALVPKGSDLYYKLLSAEPEEITIKCRLFEVLSAYFEKDKEK